jgi:ribosomal protein L11 methyltransferase
MNTIDIHAGAAAFGDGSHPTTEGMLAALAAIDPAEFTPDMVCDMGCGAGLLAMRAAQLFGCAVVAADIERTAVEATRENAQKNHLAHLIHPVHSDGYNHPDIRARAPYDMILMNILADPLLSLAHDAVSSLGSGGALIMSGMLVWQQDSIILAYQGLGLELAHRVQIADWVTLVWLKP